MKRFLTLTFGLRQVYHYWKDESREPIPFQTPGLYEYCRHPLMLGLLIAFWATPVMTVGHLLFSVATTDISSPASTSRSGPY